MSRFILGISSHFHDSAAALVRDGVVVASAAEERFTRLKHDASLPLNAAQWCLAHQGIGVEDVEFVAYHEKPLWKFERLIVSQLREFPRSAEAFRRTALTWLPEKLWIRNALIRELGATRGKIVFSDHHLSHAASAFYGSPFDEAAVLTIDGVGEWATTAMFDASAAGLTRLAEVRFPHSIGLLYSAFTAYLGFAVNEGEGTVMGLASYGTPRFADEVRRMAQADADGGLAIDLSFVKYHYSATQSFSQKFEDVFGPARDPRVPLDLASPAGRTYADVAASVQLVTEELILTIVRNLARRTRRSKLCLAGGVALNCVANHRLAKESGFEDVFVYPAAGDDGCAAGAALWSWNEVLKGGRGAGLASAALGREWSDGEIEQTLRDIGATFEPIAPERVAERAAGDLAASRTVGWLQGRFEWGPRALGNRSILADPRKAETRDVVNRQIKFREDFRPFAPAVADGAAARYFDIPPAASTMTPYMLAAAPATELGAQVLPAVVHVDGSARVQTVSAAHNPLFHDVLTAFGEATGHPALLNTSFNLKGEPIVSSPLQALRTFYSSELDALYLGAFRVPNTSLGRNYYA